MAARLRTWSIATLVSVVCLWSGSPAWAHAERHTLFPSGAGNVPEYRTDGPYLVVCKPDTLLRVLHYPRQLRLFNIKLYAECLRHGFRDIQAAVDAVGAPGTRIFVQPGVYRERPSLRPPSGRCAEIADKNLLSYEEQKMCPHLQNLVAIFGDGPDEDIACDGPLCGLQLEGTGRQPEEVVVDGRFHKLNVVRADRADGVYFRKMTLQHSLFNSLYVIETDGFAIDRMVGRWDDEYAFLTFSSDHGLYTACEAYGSAFRWTARSRITLACHRTLRRSSTIGSGRIIRTTTATTATGPA